MEKQKHTPGSWKARTFPPENGRGHYVVCGEQDQINICQTSRYDLASAADAHLIAAAPDLLAALTYLHDYHAEPSFAEEEERKAKEAKDGNVSALEAGLDRAQAAIAKAEPKA